jgi:hypothetical protein
MGRNSRAVAVSFDYFAGGLAIDRITACRVKVDSISDDRRLLYNAGGANECVLGESESDLGAVMATPKRSPGEKVTVSAIYLGDSFSGLDGVISKTNRFYRLDAPAAVTFLAQHAGRSTPVSFHSSPVGDARVCADLEAATPEPVESDLTAFQMFNAATCALKQKSPYAYLLLKDQAQIAETCSGVFLDSKTVLTAAHCLFKSDGSLHDSITVRFGTELAQSVEAAAFMPHPSYDHLSGERSFDLAVIKVAQEVDVDPLSLASAPPQTNAALFYHGFGAHGAVAGGFFPEARRTVLGGALRAVSVGEHFVGAHRDGFQTVTCRGDSGSPILAFVGGALKVVGVTSGGSGLNCQAGDIARYVNPLEVSKRDFITEHLG